ncbi:unnamed protein product [Nippostrongylus brasiliensis]|uniref:Serpentine receptor class gamma n=1 Tax=Nippostrongylus brasiliensis TaxID=27835 RepID=A0A0N4Y926_NIPBR|nr:unnamed protein product [Nippostrongylus brasiliensis]
MIILRFPLTGMATQFICLVPLSFIITVSYVFIFYLNYATIYSTLALSALRVATVLWPVDSKKYQGRLCVILLVIVYTFPFGTTWFLIPARAYFTPMDDSASVAMNYVPVFPQWHSSLCLVFVTSITFTFDTACFFVTASRWRTLTSGKSSLSSKRSERSLLLLTCSVCISLFLNCIIQFFFYNGMFLNISFFIRGFVYDTLILIPTWVFYLTHPVFRSSIEIQRNTIPVISAVQRRY